MKTPRILAASVAVLAAVQPARAVDRFWNPVSGSSWFTSANWGGVAPGALDVAVFNSTTSNPTFGSIVTVGGMRFNATAGPFYFGGTGIDLGASGITQNSSGNVTLATPITLTASQTWSGSGAGALNIAGAVDLAYYGATLTAAHPVTVSSTGTLVFGFGFGKVSGNIILDGGAMTGSPVKLLGASVTAKNGASITGGGLLLGSLVSSAASIESGSTVSVSGAIQSDGATTHSLSITGSGTSVTSSSLDVLGSGPFDVALPFSLAVGSGASLVTGAISHAAIPSYGSQMHISGGTFTAGSVGWKGAVNVSGGQVSFGAFSIVTGFADAPDSLTVSGGSFTATSTALSLIGNLNQTGGILNAGVASFSTTSSINRVSGGTFTATSTTLSNAATFAVSGGTANLGTFTNTGGSGALSLTGGTTLVTGSYVVGDASASSLGAQFSLPGGATLEVSGGLTVLAGTGSGALNLTGGTLRTASLSRTGGAFNWTGGTVAITGAGGVTLGAGQVFGSSTTLGAAQTLQITNTLTLPGGTVFTLAGGRVETAALVSQGTFQFQTGTLAVTGAGGVAIGTGGPLGSQVSLPFGAGLEVSNALSVASGGHLLVSGLASGGTGSAIASGGRVTLQNGTGRLSGAGTLTNSGLITGDGAVEKPVTNAAGGEIRGEAGKTLLFTGATGPNAGRVNLLGGTVQFAQQFTNAATGQINGQGNLYFPTTPVPSSASPTAGLMNAGNINLSGGDSQIYGTVQMEAGSRLIVSGGATASFFDVFRHSGLEVKASAGSAIVFFGDVRGAGSFTGTGTVYFESNYSPGNSPAAVSYEGDLVFGGASSLTLEIGGLTAGAQYDHLDVAGTLQADGLLTLALLDGFIPAPGDTFDLFDAGAFAGGFDAIAAPALPGDLAWDFTALATTGTVGVVPEPGIGALLVSGFALLGLRRSRRIH